MGLQSPLKMLILASGCLLLSNCNVTRMAAHFASPVLEAGTAAFESETDVQFAEAAAPSNLKLLEGMLREAPNNYDLLLLSSRGYATYTFGFLEPKLEEARILSPGAVPELTHRMEDFYIRALGYGQRALPKSLRDVLTADISTFEEALSKQKAKHVPEIFWTAYAWGSLVQLDVTNPDRLAEVPKINAMMEKVLELDESYYFAGAHLYFGALLAELPPGAGGDADQSRFHFEKARSLTNNSLLMVDVLVARYLAVRLQDYPLYHSALQAVVLSEVSEPEAARLANEIAKQRAHFYLKNADAFFLDVPSNNSSPTHSLSPSAGEEFHFSQEVLP